jgi:hypothetical protein
MARIEPPRTAAITAPAGVVVLLAKGFLALGRHTLLVNMAAGLTGLALVGGGLTERHAYLGIPTLLVGLALCAVPVIGMTHRGRGLLRRLRIRARAAAGAADAAPHSFVRQCADRIAACGWSVQPRGDAGLVALSADVKIVATCASGAGDESALAALVAARAQARGTFAVMLSEHPYPAALQRAARAAKAQLLHPAQIAGFLEKVDAWTAQRRARGMAYAAPASAAGNM